MDSYDPNILFDINEQKYQCPLHNETSPVLTTDFHEKASEEAFESCEGSVNSESESYKVKIPKIHKKISKKTRKSKRNVKMFVATPFSVAPEIYICNFCSKTYNTSQSLGGHVSKSHPGTSISYQKKILRRKER